MGEFDRNGPEMNVVAWHQVLVPGPRPSDLVEDNALPVPKLIRPALSGKIYETHLAHAHDDEAGDDAWAEKTESAAECRRGQSIIALVQVAGVDGLDWLVGEYKTGDDEEDVHHGATREDDSYKGQLNPARGDVFMNSIWPGQRSVVVLGVVAEEH